MKNKLLLIWTSRGLLTFYLLLLQKDNGVIEHVRVRVYEFTNSYK